MNNFNRLLKHSSKILSSLLLSAIVTIFYCSFPVITAIAQENQENSESIIEKRESDEKSESTSSPQRRNRSSILEAIWKLLLITDKYLKKSN